VGALWRTAAVPPPAAAITATMATTFGARAEVVPADVKTDSIPVVAAPEAGSSCPSSAAPAAIGSGGASIASSRGRCTSSCSKRLQAEHDRR
jgi:hypothetical protein